jgi:hypothetical protein
MLKCREGETVTLGLTSGGLDQEHPTVVYNPTAIARRITDRADRWSLANLGLWMNHRLFLKASAI